jgi:ATP-dependent phosphofructokinase / diphosphate-dependent phosphofructokinase
MELDETALVSPEESKEIVDLRKKLVNVDKYYNKERLRPLFTDFEMQPLFIMASG